MSRDDDRPDRPDRPDCPDRTYRVLSRWPVDNPLVAAEYPWLAFDYTGQVDGTYLSSLRYALAVFLSGRRYDLLFAGGLRLPLAFALLNKVFFWRRIPIYVGASVFLETPSSQPLRLLFQKIKAALLTGGIEKVMILSTEEIEAYHEVWGIPREKMELISFKIIDEHALDALPLAEDPYIYTGGNSERDYHTLFEAVRGTALPIKVLSTLDFSGYDVPANVELVDNDRTTRSFYGPMARARLVVIPLRGGQLRSSGQGTYLSAMYLGKCLVVSGVAGVRDLVEDGSTGVIVPPDDAAALREALLRMWAAPAQATEIGARARDVVRRRNTHQQYMRVQLANISDLCLGRGRRGNGER